MNISFKTIILGLVVYTLAGSFAFAKEAPVKGLLPEIQSNAESDEENQKTAMQSELLITQAENKAIESINSVIKKRPNDPELWYRLAELQMRRAKSGRYFDLVKGQKALQWSPTELEKNSAQTSLKKAIETYTLIEARFPKFPHMDAVLFNNAFANQQLRQIAKAQDIYGRLINKYSDSELMPDAVLAMAEMEYDKGNFKKSLVYFEKMNQYPESRLFAYAMYKSAWAYYNDKAAEKATDKLIEVVKYFNNKETTNKSEYNIRAEAIRDLELFFEDSRSPSEAYSFFSRILGDEAGASYLRLANLYLSHSRQKDLFIFLKELNEKQPNASYRVEAELKLAEAYESTRQRENVIEHLKITQKFCAPNSKWLSKNAETGAEACQKFRSFSASTANKWWDLYQKNKQHKQIAELTENIFALLLENEPNDLAIQYTYAEMLFQLQRYEQAHGYYLNVSRKTPEIKADPKKEEAKNVNLAHDSLYSSLVCLEKLNNVSSERVLEISQEYVDRFPKGEFANDVSLKMAVLNFKNKKYEESKNILNKLIKLTKKDKVDPSFMQRTEDLMIEILNVNKDFEGLHEFVKKIDRKDLAADRSKQLAQIQTESAYAKITQDAQTSEDKKTDKTIDTYLKFAKENDTSPLAQQALWQGISLAYSQKDDASQRRGALLSLEYAQKYPKDKKSTDVTKEAYRIFVQQKAPEALSTADLLIKSATNKEERNLLLAQKYELLQMQPNGKGQEISSLESELVKLDIEPAKSQIQLRKAQLTFSSGDISSAYKMTIELTRKSTPPQLKSEIYLLYAKILEKEFFQQSTKTSLERLATVIGLKTEKLDKAQSAYIMALKTAVTFESQTQAMDGLIRCYSHYIDAVSKPEFKDQPTEEEQKALNAELNQLIAPIKNKHAEFLQKKQDLTEEYRNREPAAQNGKTDRRG